MGNKNRKASSEILWRLAINLKRLREARGYSQLELARRCGLTKGYISKVEQELLNISVASLEALCDGLECSTEDLLRRPSKHEIPENDR
jgi:transcriptional regulator with XRE-family HTH domain